ncbi:uncharacterized protein BJ212DRAFT_1267955 [Suillus subaureus]|uniref:Uncharacterized protein n=1 Tax=Suillus subaureus TaxID=48587 RepID=A0A9P7JFH1_9AGAM|nr:uncharacterized protein BJ212DRAFT_1267955 [Suillus subaureus]KAG1819623.1 hypothetical protein BJ212DRAFT_1267955 [Suillus subaureus]
MASISINTAICKSPTPQVEHATPLRELQVSLNGTHSELALLDEGSEIVVIQEDVWKKMNAPINCNIHMCMQTANGSSQEMAGCLEMLEIEVEGIKSWAHVYVIPEAPYCLLLGCPWQKLIHLSKYKDVDNVYITIQDPLDSSNIHTVATSPHPWPHPSLALTAAAISITSQQAIACPAILPTSSTDIYPTILPTSLTDIYPAILPTSSMDISTKPSYPLTRWTSTLPSSCPSTSCITFSNYAEFILQQTFNVNISQSFAYKKVANKVKPVTTTMPAHAHII